MKFFILFIAAHICSVAVVTAQYKKVNSLNKDGRTYEIGVSLKQKNGGNSAATGFNINYGREYEHFFTLTELELVTGSTFNYTTTGGYGNPTQSYAVSGTTGTVFNFRYNLGYSFIDLTEDKKKFFPYIIFNLGTLLMKSQTPSYTVDGSTFNNYSIDKYPQSMNGAFLYGGGAGLIYRITPTIGVRAGLNYNGVLSFEGLNENDYKTIGNHTSFNVAVRFRMNAK
jgi:hypothetical protein